MVEANLRVVCNIGAAGLNTGEEEGTPVPGGPTMGITAFNLLSEHEN